MILVCVLIILWCGWREENADEFSSRPGEQLIPPYFNLNRVFAVFSCYSQTHNSQQATDQEQLGCLGEVNHVAKHDATKS